MSINQNGEWTYDLDNDSALVQALAQGQQVTDTFTAVVVDEFGASDTQTIDVTVTGTNDAPVISSTATDAAGTVQEDTTLTVTGQLAATDVDVLGATQSWSVLGSDTGAYGSIEVDGNGLWTYTLDNGTDGVASAVQSLAAGDSYDETFTIRVTDDQNATADQIVTVTVTGTNDAPVAFPDIVITNSQSTVGTTPTTINESENNNTLALADVITRAQFGVGFSPDVGDATLPRVSINGYISPSSDSDYYAFDLRTGETITLDIDYGMNQGVTIDTTLVLFNGSGGVITYSDDASTSLGGGGSVHPYDSYLSYTATADGTYYAAVSSYSNFPGVYLGGGYYSGDYVLNVSVSATTSATSSFDYTVSDGQGGTSTSNVTVQTYASSTLVGTGANETFIPAESSDILTGGGGDDLFIFGNYGSNVTITDFSAGAGIGDRIDVSNFSFVDGQDVIDNAATDVGANVVIALDGNDSVTLIGVNIANLHVDDFLVV